MSRGTALLIESFRDAYLGLHSTLYVCSSFHAAARWHRKSSATELISMTFVFLLSPFAVGHTIVAH